MGLETGNYIADLNQNNPTATDPVAQGDDHIRLVKKTLVQSFPNITGEVTATQDDLNKVAGGQTVNVTGMISMFGGPTPPNGWLACDGTAIPVEFTDLIALVGANTPDLRGQFVRGWSDDVAQDPGGPRAPLELQDEALLAHTHDVTARNNGAAWNNAIPWNTGEHGPLPSQNVQNATAALSNASRTTSTGGDETRPKNVTVLYIIKT